MSDEPKEQTTIYFGDESYGFYDTLTDKWNPAFFKEGKQVDKEAWERYKMLRKEFSDLHDQFLEKFGVYP